MSEPLRILLIEDNPPLARSVQLALKDHHVTVACDLNEARQHAPFMQFDLALVDVILPDGNGLEFCIEIKMGNPHLPLVIITARADEDLIVASLSVASDYVRKPFGKRELLARIHKNLGRKVSPAREIEFAGLKLKLSSQEAEFSGVALRFRPKEFAILSILALHVGDTVPREVILRHIDRDGELEDRSLDSHLSRIRKTLHTAGIKSLEVVTVQGEGYALKVSA